MSKKIEEARLDKATEDAKVATPVSQIDADTAAKLAEAEAKLATANAKVAALEKAVESQAAAVPASHQNDTFVFKGKKMRMRFAAVNCRGFGILKTDELVKNKTLLEKVLDAYPSIAELA